MPLPVKSAARIVSNILFSSRYYPYIAIVLVGGYDSAGGSIYNLDFFGSDPEEKVTSTGAARRWRWESSKRGTRKG